MDIHYNCACSGPKLLYDDRISTIYRDFYFFLNSLWSTLSNGLRKLYSVGKELADKLQFTHRMWPLIVWQNSYAVILLEECDLKHFFSILCDITTSGRKLNPLQEFVREALNTVPVITCRFVSCTHNFLIFYSGRSSLFFVLLYQRFLRRKSRAT